jgi:hypothetical protein
LRYFGLLAVTLTIESTPRRPEPRQQQLRSLQYCNTTNELRIADEDSALGIIMCLDESLQLLGAAIQRARTGA